MKPRFFPLLQQRLLPTSIVDEPSEQIEGFWVAKLLY